MSLSDRQFVISIVIFDTYSELAKLLK